MSTQRIILPGDGERGSVDSDPTVILEQGEIRDIQHTNLADEHAPIGTIRRQVAEGKEDWGDGFFVEPEPVHVLRAPDGSIVRTTPLSHIPGVHYDRGKLQRDIVTPEQVDREGRIKEVAAKETPHPLNRSDRTKMVEILARRLYNYWRERGPQDPRYNPFRDGLPELPAGSPEHLKPLPGTQLWPATDGQIMDYARRFVGERATVINRNRFGNSIEDLALRIE